MHFQQSAISDLATRLGVDEQDISVVAQTEVAWPNSAAGCPVPGMAYLQVLTNGYRIELAVGETRYTYVGKAGGPARLCANPDEPVPDTGYGNI